MLKLIKKCFTTFNKHIKEVFIDNGLNNENQFKGYLKLYDSSWENYFIPLYNETGLTWLRLIKDYNFKIFYFKTFSKISEKLVFNSKIKNPDCIEYNWKWDCKNYRSGLVLEDEGVKKIKKLQLNDLYYIYEKVIPEVFYTFPRVESDNKYTFDFILIVNSDFNLNNFFKIDFELIKIESVQELNQINLTYNKVQEIFESRFIFDDNNTTFEENESVYKTRRFSSDDYLKIYKNGDRSLYNHEEYNFLIANWSANNFDQDVYVRNKFKLLCTQIWSFDEIFYKVETKFGLEINIKCIYNVDSSFLTINKLIGKTAILNKEGGELEISDTNNYNCFMLCDDFYDQDIIEGNLNKEFIKNRFIDFDNLEIKKN